MLGVIYLVQGKVGVLISADILLGKGNLRGYSSDDVGIDFGAGVSGSE